MTDLEKPKSRRGWTSEGLTIISPDDPAFWSTADAALLLGPPPLSQAQVRQLVRLAGLEPAGKRRVTIQGRGGRHVRVFRSGDLIKAHEAVAGLISAD